MGALTKSQVLSEILPLDLEGMLSWSIMSYFVTPGPAMHRRLAVCNHYISFEPLALLLVHIVTTTLAHVASGV